MKSVICQLVEKLGTTTCFVFSPYHKDNDSNPFLNLIFYQIQILNKRMSLLETLFPIRNGTLALQIQITASMTSSSMSQPALLHLSSPCGSGSNQQLH